MPPLIVNHIQKIVRALGSQNKRIATTARTSSWLKVYKLSLVLHIMGCHSLSPTFMSLPTVSFSKPSPTSPLCHFLFFFTSIWPLTSQGPPAHASSAGLLSNQILTVKVCHSQIIIPAALVTCHHVTSQSLHSLLGFFIFHSHKLLRWGRIYSTCFSNSEYSWIRLSYLSFLYIIL